MYLLNWASLEGIALTLDGGNFTSVDLVKLYIARIDEVDYIFKPITDMNLDAAMIASQPDEERFISGRERPAWLEALAFASLSSLVSPLHRVPTLFQDNILTSDGWKRAGAPTLSLG